MSRFSTCEFRRSRLLPVALAMCATACLLAIVGCSHDRLGGGGTDPAVQAALTEDDVRAVLDSMSLADPVNGAYRVDVPAFSASVSSQLPMYSDRNDPLAWPTTFRAAGEDATTEMSRVDARHTVARALARYRALIASLGATVADSAMVSGSGSAYDSLSDRDKGLLSVLQEGACRLTFMFGDPDPSQWSWRVNGIEVTGPNTAEVTYAVSAPPGQAFRITSSSFTKRLHFAREAEGTWVLDGWLDYAAFELAARRAIRPSDEIPNLVPNWWDTLGAQ